MIDIPSIANFSQLTTEAWKVTVTRPCFCSAQMTNVMILKGETEMQSVVIIHFKLNV